MRRFRRPAIFLLNDPSSARRIVKTTDELEINRYVAPFNRVNERTVYLSVSDFYPFVCALTWLPF
ncbi:hypothetical protein ACWOEF_06510 [Enterococcus crotali]